MIAGSAVYGIVSVASVIAFIVGVAWADHRAARERDRLSRVRVVYRPGGRVEAFDSAGLFDQAGERT